jgi:hypothetical protein
MHSRLWLSDARGEPSPRAGSHYLEFFYAQKCSAPTREVRRKAEGNLFPSAFRVYSHLARPPVELKLRRSRA